MNLFGSLSIMRWRGRLGVWELFGRLDNSSFRFILVVGRFSQWYRGLDWHSHGMASVAKIGWCGPCQQYYLCKGCTRINFFISVRGRENYPGHPKRHPDLYSIFTRRPLQHGTTIVAQKLLGLIATMKKCGQSASSPSSMCESAIRRPWSDLVNIGGKPLHQDRL